MAQVAYKSWQEVQPFNWFTIHIFPVSERCLTYLHSTLTVVWNIYLASPFVHTLPPERTQPQKLCTANFSSGTLKTLKKTTEAKKKYFDDVLLRKSTFSLGSKVTARNISLSGPIDLKFWLQA